jgi:hypothetical protein
MRRRERTSPPWVSRLPRAGGVIKAPCSPFIRDRRRCRPPRRPNHITQTPPPVAALFSPGNVKHAAYRGLRDSLRRCATGVLLRPGGERTASPAAGGVEIMGSQTYRNVGGSQPVFDVNDPITSTRTRMEPSFPVRKYRS